MSKADFLTLADLPAAEWPAVWRRAAELKAARRRGAREQTLAGKSVALVFEKASTRTRVSFEVGIAELGGHPIVITNGSQLGRGEPIKDTARVLSGYCHAIMFRTFGHERAEDLARHASIPVINGLTDEHHPCQLAADLLTVLEHFGTLDGLRYAWIGDGNNMATSWIEAAGLFGLELALACPAGFSPDAAAIDAARARQRALGRGSVSVTEDPRAAAAGAHVVSTDVWASMGQEEEAEARRQAFTGYCVDAALLASAAPEARVLHCLPAHRGEEISGEVIDGPASLVWDQAENRLHAQKAILERLLVPRG
ncbi:MAG: ornithine carbamoyltransferase [Kofleriaceae bacterium]